MSEVVLTFPLVEAATPLYQQVAPGVARMRRLGLSYRQIAQAFGVDDKTVAKAARWLVGLR